MSRWQHEIYQQIELIHPSSKLRGSSKYDTFPGMIEIYWNTAPFREFWLVCHVTAVKPSIYPNLQGKVWTGIHDLYDNTWHNALEVISHRMLFQQLPRSCSRTGSSYYQRSGVRGVFLLEVQYSIFEESNIYLCFVVCRLKRGLVTWPNLRV